jgi:putative MATE family efflux protein
MAEQGRFLTGSTMGHVVRMTATGATGITFVFLVDAANLFWISRLGDPLLMAAIGYAFAIQFFTVSIGVGMMIATTAIVSRSIGAGAQDAARGQATSAMLMTFAVQALTAVVVVALREPLLRIAGAEGEALRLAARYLAISLPSLAIMAVGLCGSATLRAQGDGARAMYVTLSGGFVAMVLDPFLIYGLGWGLDGAAAGLWAFRLVMAGVAIWLCTRAHDLLARPDAQALRRTARPFAAVALPAILTQMAAPAGNYLLTGVMAGFGDAAVAAWAVINRLTVVAYGGLFSLAGAIGGIFGQNYGAKLYDRLRSTYRDAVVFCVLYALVTWALLVLASGTIAGAFGLTGDAAAVLRAFTHIGAGGFVFAGLLFVCNAAFNTLGRPGRASALNWLKETVIMWPAALWLAGPFAADGVIYAQALVGAAMGVLAVSWGWRYVQAIGTEVTPKVDLGTRHAYRDVNRYRRR